MYNQNYHRRRCVGSDSSTFTLWLNSEEQDPVDGSFNFTLPRDYIFEDGQYTVTLETLILPSNIDVVDGCYLTITNLDTGRYIVSSIKPAPDEEEEEIDSEIDNIEQLRARMRKIFASREVTSLLGAENLIKIVNEHKDKYKMKISLSKSGDLKYSLAFSDQLSRILNLSYGEIVREDEVIRCHNISMIANSSAFVVNCNLVENTPCNDHFSSMLSIHAMKRERRHIVSQVDFDHAAPRVEEYNDRRSTPVAPGRVHYKRASFNSSFDYFDSLKLSLTFCLILSTGHQQSLWTSFAFPSTIYDPFSARFQASMRLLDPSPHTYKHG